MSLALKQEHNLTSPEKIDATVGKMLEMPQAECPIKHYLGAGVYIREITIEAGVFSIGHYQNFEHMNQLVSGRVIMLEPDGTTKEYTAPMTFTYREGNKVGFIVEKMVWQNIYPNPDNEADLDALEAKFVTKNKVWEEFNDIKEHEDYLKRKIDREDYEKMLIDLNVTHEQVLAESQIDIDLIPFSSDVHCVKVGKSTIQGKGLFCLSPIKMNDIIAPARLNGKRTPAGRYTNHALLPNARAVIMNNDIYLVANRDIKGCHGGDSGEEITLDYRQINKLAKRIDI
jgi:hypothetical protein